MLSHLHNYFDPSFKHTKKKSSKYIYRGELDNKAMPPTKLKRRAYLKITEAKSPLLHGEKINQEEKAICNEKTELRVKVHMTREEAVRLLLKCKEGGLLEFSDVASELNKIPRDCVSIIDSSTSVRGQVPDSIAEEI